MMNINLNLLPPFKKNRLVYLAHFIFFKSILEITIFVCSVLAIALVWSWIALQEDFTQLAVSAASVNQDFTAINKSIKQINLAAKDINTAAANYAPVIGKVTDLISSLPNNIKLKYVSMDKKSQTLEISGSALGRNDLLNYENALKDISWIGQTTAPASALFQKENIDFDFKTTLK